MNPILRFEKAIAGRTPPPNLQISSDQPAMEGTVHQRALKLKDVALGSRRAVSVGSSLAAASYDSAVDSLLALYCECKSASSLARDKNVLKFINKCECAEYDVLSIVALDMGTLH
jgi:hypothetical protein